MKTKPKNGEYVKYKTSAYEWKTGWYDAKAKEFWTSYSDVTPQSEVLEWRGVDDDLDCGTQEFKERIEHYRQEDRQYEWMMVIAGAIMLVGMLVFYVSSF